MILPNFGHLPVGSITPAMLADWITNLDRAPATVVKARQIVAAVLEQAVEMRKLASNPAKVGTGIPLPRVPTTEMRFLTLPQVADLANAIDPHYRTLVWTAALAGLRWSELVGLKGRHLDLTRGRLTVVETLVEVKGHLIAKPPKTAASRRTISLSDSLVTMLLEQPTFGDALVFTTPSGAPVRRSAFRTRVWLPAVEASVGRPMRPHDLRHTHAALLIAQGEHAKSIQMRLGHSSIQVTLDRYGHLMPGIDEGAAARLDEAATRYTRATDADIVDIRERKTP